MLLIKLVFRELSLILGITEWREKYLSLFADFQSIETNSYRRVVYYTDFWIIVIEKDSPR